MNNNNKILPLGTIVTLKNQDDKLMITGRGTITQINEETVYFDYACVLIPYGLYDAQKLYFFNNEDVGAVVFKGYEDENEIEFQNDYDELISDSKVKRGKVV